MLTDGSIEWAALPLLAAMHDVTDLELLAHWLAVIRTETNPKPEHDGRPED